MWITSTRTCYAIYTTTTFFALFDKSHSPKIYSLIFFLHSIWEGGKEWNGMEKKNILRIFSSFPCLEV